MEMTNNLTHEIPKKSHSLFSKPLLRQSIKANLGLWLALTIGSVVIFLVINLVVGTKTVFTNIDMNKVQTYVSDEGMNWLQILGLLDVMGFSLDRIQIMSSIDLNSVMNDLVYKIAGVFLPMIYVMIVGNKLVAAQVTDGSMAYILSTPTNRRKVVRTQALFLFGSLFLMYFIITVFAFGSGVVAYAINPPKNLNFGTVGTRTCLYCLGSFVAMFAIGGICFGASTFFNKSRNSIAVGGSVCVICFLCCILGLFGNKVFVGVGIGVKAMNVFNYMTLYTLIDTESMGNFAKAINGIPNVTISYTWAYELAILAAVGIVFSVLGSLRFYKKDLPL